MPDARADFLFATFEGAAEAAAHQRAGIDPDLARELMAEAAEMLHNGLALDQLGDHDFRLLADALARDLVAEDPSVAVRARAAAVLDSVGVYDDPEVASASCLVAASILHL